MQKVSLRPGSRRRPQDGSCEISVTGKVTSGSSFFPWLGSSSNNTHASIKSNKLAYITSRCWLTGYMIYLPCFRIYPQNKDTTCRVSLSFMWAGMVLSFLPGAISTVVIKVLQLLQPHTYFRPWQTPSRDMTHCTGCECCRVARVFTIGRMSSNTGGTAVIKPLYSPAYRTCICGCSHNPECCCHQDR